MRIPFPLLRVVTVLACLSVAIAAPAGTAGAAPRLRVLSRQTLAPGVVYTRLSAPGPNRVYVLRVDLSRPVSFDVALAARRLGGFERTSSMAARHRALAAVNGDFADVSGRPMHTFAEDGALKFTTTLPWGANLAVARDERTRFLGAPAVSSSVTVPRSRTTLRIARWNDGPPRRGQVAAYTVAGSASAGPRNACAVRLLPAARPAWGARERSVRRAYRVTKMACSAAPMALDGETVLAAAQGSAGASRLKAMRTGSTVTMEWSLGWRGVLDSIGGIPVLVKGGTVVASDRCQDYFCGRNPRTAVGITADGALLLAVVDGRRPGWSVGMTLEEEGALMVALGAVRAVNLDGGGSSTMVVNGRVVNHPTDSDGERSVSSAALILPGPDRRDPLVRRLLQTGGAGSAGPALVDPGSTGGLLAALGAGDFGPAT
jgi:Phosphodiester glycosidase